MEGIPQQFLIAVESPGKEPLVIHTHDYCKKVSDLEPDTKYTISVSTVVNDRCSEPISICTCTGEMMLKHLLFNYYFFFNVNYIDIFDIFEELQLLAFIFSHYMYRYTLLVPIFKNNFTTEE